VRNPAANLLGLNLLPSAEEMPRQLVRGDDDVLRAVRKWNLVIAPGFWSHSETYWRIP